MAKALRVLLVEDREDDALLLVRELERGGFEVAHVRVETAEGMEAALSSREWDLVISDYSLPRFSGLSALACLKAKEMDLPCIVISGTIGEDTAVEVMKAGAHDFLVKGKLARLLPAVEREMREFEVRRGRRRAEEALRRSEEKYRRIVETAQEGLWTIDAEWRTTFVNRRMADMLGYEPEEMVGRSPLDFMDEEGKAIVAQETERRRHGQRDPRDFRFKRRDGSDFMAVLSIASLLDDSGRPGLLALVTDVTEQRKLQAQMLVADRMASVGTLAAGVAHEINNPLASVMTNLDLAERAVAGLKSAASLDLGELAEELRDARDAAERVRNIVRDLKVFSRTEEEKKEPVDVGRVIESSLRMARNEIRHRARLVKEIGDVPPVEANESRLGQVVLNLLVNAAQAIEEGKADVNEIGVRAFVERPGTVVVEVRDTGAGIPPEVQKRLFTPFFTTKPVGVGTGLGLSICHRIISGLGGEIVVESEVGRGSTFRISLPAALREAHEQARTFAPTEARRRGKVLIVDDEPMIGTAIRRALCAEHEVVTLTDGQQALERVVAGERFDVILCDLMMPRITGMELHAELSRVAPDQAGKMIFLTGGAFTPRAREFLERSLHQRIEKPFDTQSLRAIVNERVR